MIYAGQGPIYMGTLNTTTGELEGLKAIGCGNRTLKLALSRDTKVIKESCSGQRLDLMEFETGKSGSVSLELAQFDLDMLAVAMYGTSATIAAGTVTGEVMPTMAVGGVYFTRKPNISSVVIKDSAGTPATLVEGTDYTVDKADYGRITIKNLGTYVQPFKVDYANAQSFNLKPFSSGAVVRCLVFEGLSTADNSKVRVTLPSVQFSPTNEFNFLGEDEAVLTLEGKLLFNNVWDADPLLGSFGRIETL